MRSLLYRSPAFYSAAMRVLYWPHFEDRYRIVSELVPEGSSVVDLCCGDAYLFRRYLRYKRVRYLGLDSSQRMIEGIKREGVQARVWDARYDEIPSADIVIMQGSLCHFLPDVQPLIRRMEGAARSHVILSEPIREYTKPPSRVAAFLSRTFTTPANDDGTYRGERFTEESFTKFARTDKGFKAFYSVPGGRDMIAIFRGQDGPAALPVVFQPSKRQRRREPKVVGPAW